MRDVSLPVNTKPLQGLFHRHLIVLFCSRSISYYLIIILVRTIDAGQLCFYWSLVDQSRVLNVCLGLHLN